MQTKHIFITGLVVFILVVLFAHLYDNYQFSQPKFKVISTNIENTEDILDVINQERKGYELKEVICIDTQKKYSFIFVKSDKDYEYKCNVAEGSLEFNLTKDLTDNWQFCQVLQVDSSKRYFIFMKKK